MNGVTLLPTVPLDPATMQLKFMTRQEFYDGEAVLGYTDDSVWLCAWDDNQKAFIYDNLTEAVARVLLRPYVYHLRPIPAKFKS